MPISVSNNSVGSGTASVGHVGPKQPHPELVHKPTLFVVTETGFRQSNSRNFGDSRMDQSPALPRRNLVNHQESPAPIRRAKSEAQSRRKDPSPAPSSRRKDQSPAPPRGEPLTLSSLRAAAGNTAGGNVSTPATRRKAGPPNANSQSESANQNAATAPRKKPAANASNAKV